MHPKIFHVRVQIDIICLHNLVTMIEHVLEELIPGFRDFICISLEYVSRRIN